MGDCGRELSSTSLVGEYLRKLFLIFLYRRSFSSPLFLYFFNRLLVWIHRYLFDTLSYIQYYLLHFVVQIVPALAIGRLFMYLCIHLFIYLLTYSLGDLLVGSSVPLTWPHHCGAIFFSFSNSLLSPTTRSAILYIPYPSPRSTIYPRRYGSFYFDRETKMWELDVLTASEVSLFLDRAGKCVCILTHAQTQTYNYCCLSIST